jgi:hypothetical protein
MNTPRSKWRIITKLKRLEEYNGITLFRVVVFLKIKMRFHFSTR